MKYLFLTIILLTTLFSFGQKKVKYKRDVYDLIKEEKFEEAFPVLVEYLEQDPDHVNANYWAGKMFETLAYGSIDIQHANKAKEHYKTCRDNVTILEMNVLNSSRYPDVSGLDGEERLANFNDFLENKIVNLRGFEDQIDKKMIDENFKNYEEFISATNLQLPEEIEKLKLINITSRYEKIILGNRYKLEGYLGFDAISPLTKEKVIFQGSISKGKLNEGCSLKRSKVKPEKKQVNSVSIKEIENLFNFNFLKYLGYSVRDDEKVNGTIDMIKIGDEVAVGGEFNLKGNNVELKGQYDGQNGTLTAIWMNYDTYGEEAIKLTLADSEPTSFRYEVRYNGGTHKFYEKSSDLKNINSSSYLEFELKDNPQVELDSESQILKYTEYVNNEDEGADVIMIGYSFEDKRGKNIFIDQSEVPERLRVKLGKEENYNSWYIVNFSKSQTETEIFLNTKPILKITQIEETEVFDLNSIAEKYDKKLNQSELNQLNSLGQKWVESFKEGDYKLYKSLVLKPYQMTLSRFTETTKDAKGVNYKSIDKYVIAPLVYAYDKRINMSYNEFVKSGADESSCVLTINNIEKYGNISGTFRYIKYNGVWKIVHVDKRTMKNKEFNKIKAIDVISKNPPKMCDCVNETADGNQFMAQKCFLYYNNQGDKSAIRDMFINCLNESNYCSYKQTTDKIGASLSGIYLPDEEQAKKLSKLRDNCK